MKFLKTPVMVVLVIALFALQSIVGGEAVAQPRSSKTGCKGKANSRKSGCKGKVSSKRWINGPDGKLTAVEVREWKLYEWPAKSSKIIATVQVADPIIWVFIDYEAADFYLVSKCNREAGADCIKEDNRDDKPGNDPQVGFLEKLAIDTLSSCHEHCPALPNGHNLARTQFRNGESYYVRSKSREVFLRSVEEGNENHPYGLLRARDRFIKDKVSANKEWMFGWAHSSARGVNPRMRYGKVAYSNGRYLTDKKP